MAGGSNAESTNRILASLSGQSRRRLLPALSRAFFPRGHLLYEAGATITRLYFVESGLVALTKPTSSHRSVAFSVVGREGLVPPTAIFGIDRTIVESVVLIPTTVRSVELRDFRAHLSDELELTQLLQRYVATLLSQFVQTAACNVLHAVEARCASWMLVADDSSDSASFPLTHDALAAALAIRRESVSIAAKGLLRSGLISYCYGSVTILDRQGLERVACECYEETRALFDALFGDAKLRNERLPQ